MSEAATVVDIETPSKRRKAAIAAAVAPSMPASHSPTVAVPDPMIAMIERVIRDPSADITKLQAVLDVKERLDRQRNESAFNDKMAAAQAEMKPIRADAENPQTRSKYASYAALDNKLRPIYTRHGFALSFNTADGPDSCVRVLCDVTCSGHTRQYRIDMPADGKGPKGNDVMSKTHATGSAATYGMRYLLKMIFNVAIGEADDDGNKAGAKSDELVSDAQVEAISKKILEVKADVNAFLRLGEVESISEIRADQFDRVMQLLDMKKRK